MRAKLNSEMHFCLLHLIYDDLVANYLSFELLDNVINQGEMARSIGGTVELYEFKDSRWDLQEVQKLLEVHFQLLLSDI